MNYETATHVRVEPQGPIWRALLFAGDRYLGGEETVVRAASSDRQARLMVHDTLAARHVNAGLVDDWLPGPDGTFVIPVAAF